MIFSSLARAKMGVGRGATRCDEPFASEGVEAATLAALHLDAVFAYASRRLDRREDAEDVCAETFAAAFEQLPRFRGEVEVRLWLLGIARRKVADALRKRARRREIELPADFEAPDERTASSPSWALSRAEARQTMQQLLFELKDEQREVLLLRYVEELSVEEIAVVIGRSKAATNSLLQRARKTVFRAGQSYFLPFEPVQRGEL